MSRSFSARRLAHASASARAATPPADASFDAIVCGGGHNGLTAAAYLARAGLRVCVTERRERLGGAAVSEQIVPGFTFSRASYLAGLLRPSIITQLGLEKHGFKYLPRDPSSFTPTALDGPHAGKSLIMGADAAATARSVAQFSEKDAAVLPKYEEFLSRVRSVVTPLLDGAPPDITVGGLLERLESFRRAGTAGRALFAHPGLAAATAELFTAPASHILDRWFESDVLKATLATDAVIGALHSPCTPGSGYVLLHHVSACNASQSNTLFFFFNLC